jgi:hypothetical protein
VSTATAPAAGEPWALQQGDVTQGAGGYASDIGASLGSGGTPLFSWAGTSGTFVHAGTDPSTTNYNVQTQLGGCCGDSPDLGYDASTGDAWVAWASDATDHVGLYAQKVNADTGAPIGSAARLPQSATTFGGSLNFNPPVTRTPIVTGAHAAYVAYTAGYPSTNRVLLWKLSSAGISAPIVVGAGSNLRTPGIAADSKGRVWVTWSTTGSAGPVEHARRSNAKVTRFGATVSVSRSPAGDCQDIFELTPAAATSRLHMVGTFEASCSSTAVPGTERQRCAVALPRQVDGHVHRDRRRYGGEGRPGFRRWQERHHGQQGSRHRLARAGQEDDEFRGHRDRPRLRQRSDHRGRQAQVAP